jgi:hypothetical protein
MRYLGIAILVFLMPGPARAQHHHLGPTGGGHHGMGMVGHAGMGMVGHPGMGMVGHPGMGMGLPTEHEIHVFNLQRQQQLIIEHQVRVEHHHRSLDDFGRYLHEKDPRLDRKHFHHEDPYEFDRWLKQEEWKHREGKPHDPYYDHYRRYQEERREEVIRRERERDLLRIRLGEEYRRLHGMRLDKITEHHPDRREHLPPTRQEREIIAQIRMIHTRLRQVDWDFKGERAEAMDSLARTIGHLGSSPPPKATGLSLGTTQKTQSIVALRQAKTELATMERELAVRPEALQAIRQAIQHLDTALAQSPH